MSNTIIIIIITITIQMREKSERKIDALGSEPVRSLRGHFLTSIPSPDKHGDDDGDGGGDQ